MDTEKTVIGAGESSPRPHGSQFCQKHTNYIAPRCPICLIDERDRLREAMRILDHMYAEWMAEKQGKDLIDGLDPLMEDAKRFLTANARLDRLDRLDRSEPMFGFRVRPAAGQGRFRSTSATETRTHAAADARNLTRAGNVT